MYNNIRSVRNYNVVANQAIGIIMTQSFYCFCLFIIPVLIIFRIRPEYSYLIKTNLRNIKGFSLYFRNADFYTTLFWPIILQFGNNSFNTNFILQ